MSNLSELAGPLGETVARDIATPEQRDAALRIQGRAVALVTATAMDEQTAINHFKNPSNIRALDDKNWQTTKDANPNIAGHENAGFAQVISQNGVNGGVPRIGTILEATGAATRPQLNIALEAQAEARSLTMGKAASEGASLPTIPDPRASKFFAIDPVTLQNAQLLAYEARGAAADVATGKISLADYEKSIMPRVQALAIGTAQKATEAGLGEIARTLSAGIASPQPSPELPQPSQSLPVPTVPNVTSPESKATAR